MGITDLSVKRPIGTIMFFIGILLLGYISLTHLSINLLPDLSYPKITVLTEYQGSGPEEIEKFITSYLEPELTPIANVKKVTSISKEGISIITLEFHWGTDMDFALLHTKEKIEEMRRILPEDCEAPIILEWDPSSSPIITTILKSKTMNMKNLKETAEFIIKPRLEQVEGIARVEIRGGNEEEISVEIDPEKIKNIGANLNNVVSAIKENNIFQSGGTVKKDKFKYTLKIEGEVKSPEQIDKIVVTKLKNRNILIKDIGRAFYKNKIKQGDIRFNSSESIALLIYRESAGNTVNATRAAEQCLSNMKKEFKNLDFFIIAKEAELITSSINSLKYSLYLGALLAFFVLLLFLQNFRDPILVSTVIPVSIISTFVLMYFFKVNINIMSLGGLVLGVGMFVDNSIIVLESIYRHRDNEKLIPTIIHGTKEVSGAITASTLTTISIFIPVIYLYGITGKLFRDQALTVSFSLISSLIVAVTLLPALSSFKTTFKLVSYKDFEKETTEKWFHYPLEWINFILLLPFKIIGNILYFIIYGIYSLFKNLFKYLAISLNFLLKPIYRWFNILYENFDNYYHKILEKIMNKKIIALWICLVVIVSIFASFLILKKELLPSPESSKFEIKANTSPVYGFEETNMIASKIEKKLSNIEGVDFVYTESGAVSKFAARTEDFSVNSIHYLLKCKSHKLRSKVMKKARAILQQKDLLNYSIFLEKNTLSQYLSTSGENFQIKVFYENIKEGKKAVNLIVSKIKDIKGLYDLKSTTSEGKPLFTIKFKQNLLNQLNITKREVASFINQAVRGQKAGELKKYQENFDIFVRVPITGIMGIDQLLSLPISINNNSYFIKDLIYVKELPSIKEISRESQERYFLISGDVKGAKLDSVIKKAEKKLEDIELPTDTRFIFSGEKEERKKAFNSLEQAIFLAIILVYMIMAAKFENIVQPFIIMLTVPMGVIGAFLFLLISGNSLNVISGIGILVLIGIGVNDAIVKVEYSNQLRKQGWGIRDAIIKASKVRLRPILMTSLTTIFGLIPMAMMKQAGSELQHSLAYVIIGGLIFTTLLTLILIPVFYEILEEFKEKKKIKIKEGK